MKLEERPKIYSFTATSIKTPTSKPYMLFAGKGNLKVADNHSGAVVDTKVKKLNFYSKHKSK